MQGRQDFPILTNIRIQKGATNKLVAWGIISNDKRFDDGTEVKTSYIVNIDIANKTLQTKNTLYRMGDLE